MKVNPTSDNVLVRKIIQEEKTSGGIFLPDTSLEKSYPIFATVVAVGPGREKDGITIPVEVSPGDEILIEKYCGSKIEVNGETLHLLQENNIFAKVERG